MMARTHVWFSTAGVFLRGALVCRSVAKGAFSSCRSADAAGGWHRQRWLSEGRGVQSAGGQLTVGRGATVQVAEAI